MRQRKWWWVFFIWGIWAAGVNAYKIYETIYDDEVAKKTPNLPPKWTHARFLEKLVYDFVFPGRSRTKSSADTALTGLSVCSFSVSYCDGDEEDVYDLWSSGGRKERDPNETHEMPSTWSPHLRIST
jgi:hypothetical protein